MAIKSILLSLTTLLLGVLLFTNVVSAQDGYCSSTKVILKYLEDLDNSHFYAYSIKYPSYQGSTNCLMNTGAKGDGVESLQRSLNNCYFQTLTVDGAYGPLTKAALKVAQKAVGTSQDGVFGPVTGSLINWWTASTDGGPTTCLSAGTSV